MRNYLIYNISVLIKLLLNKMSYFLFIFKIIRLNFIFYGISCENYRRELFKIFKILTGSHVEKKNTYQTVMVSQSNLKFLKTNLTINTKAIESKL